MGESESLRLQVFRHVQDGIPLFVETRSSSRWRAARGRSRSRERSCRAPFRVRVGRPAGAGREGRPARAGARRPLLRERQGARRRPSERDRPPEGAAQGALAAARSVGLRRRRNPAAGRDLRPHPIDPSRTELPEEWRALPAFLLEPGASLVLKEVRRGEAEPPPDALTLARELWLDPDGRAASVRDRFGGTLRATTRLDLLPPGALGRIAVDGQDQLVTAQAETKAAGVELRRSALSLEADSRLGLGGPIPAVGWTTGVEQLRATLHVPPGWSLLGSTGVDRLPGTWTSRWTLLGFFFVLVVTLAVHRLFGLRPAALALAALVFSHGEPGAPFTVWLSLVAAIALGRVAPAGWIPRVARLVSSRAPPCSSSWSCPSRATR